MVQVLNFEVQEVTGYTKEEALEKAPFGIVGDASMAYQFWKKRQKEGITDAMRKKFFLDYLQKKTKCVSGAGFYITLEKGQDNTKLRPYKVTDVKNTKGPRTKTKVYQLRDKDTKQILGEATGSKVDAKKKLDEIYQTFRGNIECLYTYQITEGEPLAFTAEYSPSLATKIGTYLVFGIKN